MRAAVTFSLEGFTQYLPSHSKFSDFSNCAFVKHKTAEVSPSSGSFCVSFRSVFYVFGRFGSLNNRFEALSDAKLTVSIANFMAASLSMDASFPNRTRDLNAKHFTVMA